MKFGKVMDLVNPDLYISPLHDRWMVDHPNAEYSDEAKAFAARELGKPDRIREGTISASSLNACSRQQQFKFMGWEELPITERLAGIFHNGTFTHLRWQMAGLSAGWLARAEVPVPDNVFGLSGTADGLCADGSLLEIKSINSFGYRGVASFGAKEDHQYQLGTYMMAMGIEKGRFIYENKDTQDYVEIPFKLTDEMRSSIQLRADNLWGSLNSHKLHDPLEKCIDHEGKYKWCPFRDRCLGVDTWDEARTQVKVKV